MIHVRSIVAYDIAKRRNVGGGLNPQINQNFMSFWWAESRIQQSHVNYDSYTIS